MLTASEIRKVAWPIVSRPLRNGEGQLLAREFRWSGSIDGANVLVVAPVDFVWDGASIPRWAWTFIGSPFTGKYQQASLVHDALYEIKSYWSNSYWHRSTRKFADNMFYQIMLADDVEEDKAMLMWKVVRLGGGSAWRP